MAGGGFEAPRNDPHSVERLPANAFGAFARGMTRIFLVDRLVRLAAAAASPDLSDNDCALIVVDICSLKLS